MQVEAALSSSPAARPAPCDQVPEPTACDVLVIGGGPAGATAATLLARRGRKVVMLEKETHPRFHIGESLLPQNLTLFARLGVLDEVARIGVYKPGAEFVSDAHGGKIVTFDFVNGLDLAFDHSFQVRRSELDELLFRHSQKTGVDAHEGMRVTAVELGVESGSLVTATDAAGAEHSWRARFVVDASGRDTFLAGKLDLKARDRHNHTAALFGHFENVSPLREVDRGHITVHLFEAGWCWVIPLRNGVTSIGIVGHAAFFKSRGGTPLDTFLVEKLRTIPSLARRTQAARLVSPVTATGNYSYAARRMSGDGYILIGDAFAFIDPVFSSGVHLAMSSAALGAEAVDAWLDDPRAAQPLFRRFEREVQGSLRTFAWLIYRINNPILRDLFMAPRNLLRMRDGIVMLLGGRTRPSLRDRLPVWAFKSIFYASVLAHRLGLRASPALADTATHSRS